MKLNFWQIIGIALLIVGVVLLFRTRTSNSTVPVPNPSTTSPLAP